MSTLRYLGYQEEGGVKARPLDLAQYSKRRMIGDIDVQLFNAGHGEARSASLLGCRV